MGGWWSNANQQWNNPPHPNILIHTPFWHEFSSMLWSAQTNSPFETRLAVAQCFVCCKWVHMHGLYGVLPPLPLCRKHTSTLWVGGGALVSLVDGRTRFEGARVLRLAGALTQICQCRVCLASGGVESVLSLIISSIGSPLLFCPGARMVGVRGMAGLLICSILQSSLGVPSIRGEYVCVCVCVFRIVLFFFFFALLDKQSFITYIPNIHS